MLCRAMPCCAVRLPRGWRHSRGPAMLSLAPRPCSRAWHRRPPRSRRHCLSCGCALGPGVPVSAGADGPPPCLTLAHAHHSVAALTRQGRLHVSCGRRHTCTPACHTRTPTRGYWRCLSDTRACTSQAPAVPVTLSPSHTRTHRGPRLCVTLAHVCTHGVVTGPRSACHLYTHTHHGPQLCPLCTRM